MSPKQPGVKCIDAKTPRVLGMPLFREHTGPARSAVEVREGAWGAAAGKLPEVSGVPPAHRISAAAFPSCSFYLFFVVLF